jgi:hypothetical protein
MKKPKPKQQRRQHSKKDEQFSELVLLLYQDEGVVNQKLQRSNSPAKHTTGTVKVGI